LYRNKAFGSHVSQQISNYSGFSGKNWLQNEFSMEKKGIFSVESSFFGFAWPSGFYDLQNDGSYGNKAFGSHVSQ